MKNYIICITLFIFLSCKSIFTTVYGVNKNINLGNKKNYDNLLLQKYPFLNKKFFFYVKEKNYDEMMNRIVERKTDYYIGLFLNDSTEIKESNFLLENESCLSRIIKETSSNTRESINSDFFKDLVFYNIENNNLLNLNKTNTKKLVLVFSCKYGSLKNKDFKEIIEYTESNKDVELVIITLDNYDALQL